MSAQLNLCSIGDPRDPRTWSGTPNRLVNALEAKGRLQTAFDVELPTALKSIAAALNAPFYGNFDHQRQPLRRFLTAERARRATQSSGSPFTLHMGSLSLPFFRPPAEQRHFLFCDATWSLWAKGATDMGRHKSRMVDKAQALEARAYSQISHFFPIAHYVGDDLQSTYGIPRNRITPVGTGLGVIEPFLGQKDYTKKSILFTAKGRFRDKGGDIAVAAFRRIREQVPEATMTIVGCEDGVAVDPIDGLTTLGFVPLAHLQALFETHSLFLLPAVNEPWGLVYLEAMACGMPIVGLDLNSFPELSGNGRFGFGTSVRNADAVASLIIAALGNTDALREKGHAAREHCLSTYTWAKTVDRILAVLDDRYS